MKKKQLVKLKQQFKPSYTQVQVNFLHLIERQAEKNFGLSIEVSILANHSDRLLIYRKDLKGDKATVSIPIDENYHHVLKRIQAGEKGLADRFSANLAEEIARYWQVPLKEPDENKQMQTQASAAVMTFAEFGKKIAGYPNFYLKKEHENIELKEKSNKGDRLLAVISTQKTNRFQIESALQRKYKLKLEVIPLIEKFAATPVESR